MRQKSTTLEEMSIIAGKAAGLAQNIITDFSDEKLEAMCADKRTSIQTEYKCVKEIGCTKQDTKVINCGANNKLKCDGDYIVEFGKACDPNTMLCVNQDPIERDDYCTDLYSCPSSNEVKVTFRKCSEGGCTETGSKTKECKTTFTCSGTTKLEEACDRCAAGAAAASSLTVPKPADVEGELYIPRFFATISNVPNILHGACRDCWSCEKQRS